MQTFSKLIFIVALIASTVAPIFAETVTPQTIDERYAVLPPFFYEQTPRQLAFDPKGYLALAVTLQKMGKERAIEKLREFAKRADNGKVIPLCRMLFTAKPGGTFRRSALGTPAPLPRADGAPWPLEPIALVNDIPFLITSGHLLAGMPEPAGQYLDYCIAECDWNNRPYRALRVATMGNYTSINTQLEAACAALLLQSTTPKDKWPDDHWITFMAAQLKTSAAYLDASETIENVRFLRQQNSATETDTAQTNEEPNSPPAAFKITPNPSDFSTRQQTLRKLLDLGFDLKSSAQISSDEFDALLTLFAERRRRDEFVRKLTLQDSNNAVIYFTNGGMHGGGMITFKKQNGRWIIEGQFYVL